jgi:sigma-B regulation protein RsbU (phosphoserine phosphatase)
MTGLARYTLRGAAMRERSPGQALLLLDEAIRRDGGYGSMFVSAIMAALDPLESGFHVTLASGGHTEAVLHTDEGCRLVHAPGTILGVLRDAAASDVTFELTAGDVLVLYTDGVTEAKNAGGERFDTDRLIEVVRCTDAAPRRSPTRSSMPSPPSEARPSGTTSRS